MCCIEQCIRQLKLLHVEHVTVQQCHSLGDLFQHQHCDIINVFMQKRKKSWIRFVECLWTYFLCSIFHSILTLVAWKGEQNDSELNSHFSLLFLIPCPLFLFFFSLPLSPVCLSCIIYCCWCSLSARLVFIYLFTYPRLLFPSPSVLYDLLNTLYLFPIFTYLPLFLCSLSSSCCL